MTKKHGTDKLEETLAEREVQHGNFVNHAHIEMQLRNIIEGHGKGLTIVQKAGLLMIVHKIARILNRGHNHSDTWHDIAGYARLVEKSILNDDLDHDRAEP